MFDDKNIKIRPEPEHDVAKFQQIPGLDASGRNRGEEVLFESGGLPEYVNKILFPTDVGGHRVCLSSACGGDLHASLSFNAATGQVPRD